jgi:hypothetical protein
MIGIRKPDMKPDQHTILGNGTSLVETLLLE